MDVNSWKETGNYFPHEKREHFFRCSATSDELTILIHGFPTSSYDFHLIWDALADHFPIAAADLTGYGFSDKPTDIEYTTTRQADVIEAFVHHLGARRVHLLTHDYGNTITQELLARRNDGQLDFEIVSICMLNGALFPETHRPILAQKLLISPLGAVVGRLIPDFIFKRNLALVFGKSTQPSASFLNAAVTLLDHHQGRRNFHKLIRYMSERVTFRERWVGALATMTMPYRMINGLADPVSGEHLVRRFRELFPAFDDIVELPGIGHFPQIEAPDAVISAYLEFRQARL